MLVMTATSARHSRAPGARSRPARSPVPPPPTLGSSSTTRPSGGRTRPPRGSAGRRIDAFGGGHADAQPGLTSMCAIIRTVVVLPLVPVTATIGIRDGGRRVEPVDDRAATSRAVLRWARGACAARGRVDLDDRAPCARAGGAAMSASRMSTPPMSSPAAAAARPHMAATSGCTSSVTSALVPPVDRLPLRRSATTAPGPGTDRVAPRGQVRRATPSDRDPGQRRRVTVAPAGVRVGQKATSDSMSWCPSPVTEGRPQPATRAGSCARPRPAPGSQCQEHIPQRSLPGRVTLARW